MRVLAVVGLLSLMLFCGGCQTTVSAGSYHLLANHSDGIWVAREAVRVNPSTGTETRYQVLFFCRKTETHPKCYSFEHVHGKQEDLYWPAGMPGVK